MANLIFYLGEMAKNKTISVCYLFKHLLKTKVDYLHLILRDFFINFTLDFISLSLTPLFLLIFKLLIFTIISYKMYLYLSFITIVSIATVLFIIFKMFITTSQADFVVDFKKIFLTSLVIFIAASKVTFISARLPAIVISYIVVSSFFF